MLKPENETCTYTLLQRVVPRAQPVLRLAGVGHDGAEAGTTGLSKRAEAVEVQVLPQGQVPRGYDASQAACVTR